MTDEIKSSDELLPDAPEPTIPITECEYCGKRLSATGMGRHRAMHVRKLNGENKTGETPNDKVVARLKQRCLQRLNELDKFLDEYSSANTTIQTAHHMLAEFRDDIELLGILPSIEEPTWKNPK